MSDFTRQLEIKRPGLHLFVFQKHLWMFSVSQMYLNMCTIQFLLPIISFHFKKNTVENNVQGSWLQAKPLLEECPVRKICQELKEKYTSKIITDDSGLVLWWRQHCMALCEKTGNMPKLLLQEGNLSKPGCSGIANTTGEIRESDSACNYC